MPSPLDRFAPCSRFALPDGSVLTIGTITGDDDITKDVFISHEDPSEPDSALQLTFPPKSVDLLIRALQERANEARFVNGEPMMEYPEPMMAKRNPKGKTQRKPAK